MCTVPNHKEKLQNQAQGGRCPAAVGVSGQSKEALRESSKAIQRNKQCGKINELSEIVINNIMYFLLVLLTSHLI